MKSSLMKSDSSFTDISSLSFLQTCSCSTCTCSNKQFKSDYLDNTDDCLTYAFIILYESSIWCMQIIYELFFKSLWQVLLYVKQELEDRQSVHKTISAVPINNSASANYPLICKKRNYSEIFETRHRPISNQILSEQKDNSCIVLVPVRSTYCQTEILKNDGQTINVDFNQSEKNIQETFSRRLHEPLIFTNRDIYCRQNQTSFFSTVPSTSQKICSDLVSFQQQSPNETLYEQPPRYSADQNTKLSTNTSDKSSLRRVPDSTDNSQPFSCDSHHRKSMQKKFKQNRRIIEDKSIALALATSLHSNISLCNEDYFRTKYIHQLFINQHDL